MSIVKCPSCGNVVEVTEKKSGFPWLIGCLVAVVAIPVIVAVIGLLAAIAIPSFVKARNTSQMNACINNMRQIDAAKKQWSLNSDIATSQQTDTTSVNKYIKGSVTPLCPADGTYTYHDLGQDPECSVHGLLSNPRESKNQSRTR